MAVTPDDVRRIADLARLAVPEARVPALVAELNGILAHMDELARVDAAGAAAAELAGQPGMRLRPDTVGDLPVRDALPGIAPAFRDGFFLVPRLATHEDAGGEG
jgi:aspartyl-tRNA(Asn)/glutamyl-tRNA(Gln) amidotransferase subunit C